MRIFYLLIFAIVFGLNGLFAQQLKSFELKRPQQKTVLITGGANGIGLAAALKFQQQGWSVWAGSRTPPEEGAVNLPGLHYIHLDVTNPELVEQAINTIMKETGRIDVLVNTAAYGLIGCAESVTVDEAKELFDVNFFGVLRMVQAVAPIMREQQRGSIVMLSATMGVNSCPGLDLYASSKFALEGLTEALAAELSFWNIRVNLIEPLLVKTDWVYHCKNGTAKTNNSLYQRLIDYTNVLLRDLREKGQSREAIAEIVYNTATKQSDFRVQTSNRSQKLVESKLVDPSGNLSLREQTLIFHRLIAPR